MSGKWCSVTTCSNNYKKTKNVCVINESNCTFSTIMYHTFPKSSLLRRVWIRRTGRAKWQPTSNSCICSEHFRDNDYLKDAHNDLSEFPIKRTLKPDAVPTLELPDLTYIPETQPDEENSRSGEERETSFKNGYESPLHTSTDEMPLIMDEVLGKTYQRKDRSVLSSDAQSPELQEKYYKLLEEHNDLKKDHEKLKDKYKVQFKAMEELVKYCKETKVFKGSSKNSN